MANRYFQQFQGTLEHGIVKLFGSFTTSTSGTIVSSSCKGFSVAKTANKTGRYTVTLEDSYVEFKSCLVNIVGAADSAYTTAKGVTAILRNVSVSDSTPTFQIQFVDADGSAADAELEDAAQVYLEITLKNSTQF